VVDTFASSLATDTDTGGYELIVTSYTDPILGEARPVASGDTLLGGNAADVLIGGTGDDRLVGTNIDIYLNASSDDVTGPNTAPIAAPDLYNGFQDAPIQILDVRLGLLANDLDPERDPIRAVLLSDSGPTRGNLTLNPDGTFTYVPFPGQNGQDGFSYRAFDGALYSEPVTVTLNLATVDPLPIAEDDEYQTPKNTALVVAA
jgi:hypothetical protein